LAQFRTSFKNILSIQVPFYHLNNPDQPLTRTSTTIPFNKLALTPNLLYPTYIHHPSTRSNSSEKRKGSSRIGLETLLLKDGKLLSGKSASTLPPLKKQGPLPFLPVPTPQKAMPAACFTAGCS
jgi:hypothetical protein